MRIGFALIVLMALLAPLLAGDTISNAKFEAMTGLQLPNGQDAGLEARQILIARVVDMKAVTRVGFTGLKLNDEVQVTLLSQRDKKLKLMHVPSRQVVALNYSAILVDFK